MSISGGTSWNDISKEEFDSAYFTHPPNKWQKWMFKYFSKNSEHKRFSPSWIVTTVLSISFLIGFIGTVVNAPRLVIAMGVYIFSGVLVVVGFNILFVIWTNNLRLRKIRKLLGLTRREYERVVTKYYP